MTRLPWDPGSRHDEAGDTAVRITIVDYGMGNIRSVHNALTRLGCVVTTSHEPDTIVEADALVLPGVGAFGEAVANLEARRLVAPLLRAVLDDKKPILGICLGMQLLASESEERGNFRGLSLIPGKIRRIPVPEGFRLPHVGWNPVRPRRDGSLFKGIHPGSSFYFVHGYHYVGPPEFVTATTDYGVEIVAAIQREHVLGTQFHPERSQSNGLALLRNFIAYAAAARHKETMQC